ncbi:MAG: DUF5658 family protein [Haloarculaceae archaeon]
MPTDTSSAVPLDDEFASLEGLLWLVVLASLTADVYLTYRGLRTGLVEGNPAMRAAFEVAGFAALGLVKVLIVGTAGLYRAWRPRHGVAVALGLALPWAGAVLVNCWHLL